HDAALIGQEPTTLGSTKRIAVAAENVRHLQRGPHRPRLFGWDDLQRELIKRTRRPGDQPSRNLGVARRRLKVAVPEQNLDDPDMSAALKKVSSKAMPQRGARHMLADPRAAPRSATSRLESAGADDSRAPDPETATNWGGRASNRRARSSTAAATA